MSEESVKYAAAASVWCHQPLCWTRRVAMAREQYAILSTLWSRNSGTELSGGEHTFVSRAHCDFNSLVKQCQRETMLMVKQCQRETMLMDAFYLWGETHKRAELKGLRSGHELDVVLKLLEYQRNGKEGKSTPKKGKEKRLGTTQGILHS